MPERPEQIVIDSIPVDAFTIDTLHECLDRVIRRDERAIIGNVNLHSLAIARRAASMRAALKTFDYIFCDGHGVMLLARIQGQRLPQKITYAHWLPLLAGHCAQRGYSLYLLGGKPGTAELASSKMMATCPELNICGVHHGYFDRHSGCDDMKNVISDIEKCDPDILVIGMGVPVQEEWIMKFRDSLSFKVALPAGAAIDYMAEKSKRPPAWMTGMGLEWLGRLLDEPARLSYRYLLDMPCYMVGFLMRRLTGQ